MKKTAGPPKKTNSHKKTVQNVKKKQVKKRKKTKSNTLKAFMLVGVLVGLSAIISLAVLLIYSNVNKTPQTAVVEHELPVEVTVEPETVAVTAPPVSQPVNPVISVSTTQQPVQERPPVETAPAATNVTTMRPPEHPVENLGTLVFVIDDAGNNLRELEPFLSIPGPLTIAVLPGLPYSAEAARRIRAAGKEVFLHQPMEALGAQDPGPGAIYSGMKADEIRSILKRNIEEVGPVAGINNHQGSRITMDNEAVETILNFCAENNLYFLDSRTTAETVVPSVARRMGMQIAERNVFIDNEQDKESMARSITGGLTRAQRNGSAIMIGHTWSPELAPLLNEQIPLFLRQGYTIKTASDIIKSK